MKLIVCHLIDKAQTAVAEMSRIEIPLSKNTDLDFSQSFILPCLPQSPEHTIAGTPPAAALPDPITHRHRCISQDAA